MAVSSFSVNDISVYSGPWIEAGESTNAYSTSHSLSSETLYNSGEIAGLHVVDSFHAMLLVSPIDLLHLYRLIMTR